MSTERDVAGTLYHIRVQGNLDQKWANWFEGFALSPCGNGETLLIGRVADQAALQGILVKINNLGLPLLLVAQVEHSSAGKCCPLCGHSLDFDP